MTRALLLVLLVSACSDALESSVPRRNVVFVVAMENHDATQIYGNFEQAPFVNGSLLPAGAHAANYRDDLPDLPSEPHYIWMEAGTNVFADWVSNNSGNPSSANSTASPEHLVSQLAHAGVSWMSYQEGLSAETGACPVFGAGLYAPRHNPFVFFNDVSGAPPSSIHAYCAQHHRSTDALPGDLTAEAVARYNFITPNLCNDMHGDPGCPPGEPIRFGDEWLAANLPPIIAYAHAHEGVVLVVWDEPAAEGTLPFIALGPGIKAGYTTMSVLSHSSLLKSVEQMLGVPTLPAVSHANDFSELFDVDR